MAMVDPQRSPQWFDDPLLRWIVGLAIGLTVLHGALYLYWGSGPVIVVLPWFVPAVHSFMALAALSIAFLSFGRYRVLRQPAAFWIGVGFAAFTIYVLFYVISWPDLVPGTKGFMTIEANASSWFYHLQFSALVIFMLVAVFARWPRAGSTGERRWFWLVLGGMAAFTLMGWLLVIYQRFLPVLVSGGVFTPLNQAWNYPLVAAFLAGAFLSAWRYRQTGDPVFGYMSLAELQLGFAVLTVIIGGEFYDIWWYWQRALWVGGISVMLFGLLSEYVGLYRREQQKTQELEELQREVQRERSRLQAVLDTAPVGIVFLSAPDVRPLLFNKAAENILGRPLASVGPDEMPAYYGILRPSGELFPPEDLPISRSLRGQTSTGVEMLVSQPSGRQVFILMNSAPLCDAKGQIVGVILAFQDITPIKEQERLRDEFISAAAHELKTPVTTIKGYAQLMRQGALQPGREGEVFEAINSQTDRINRRVQEMLEAIRLRKAPPELLRVRFDLGELASKVVRRMQAMTGIHRLLFDSEGPAPVNADRERIEEVLVSLLDNAMKFSPKGGDIEVRVWADKGEALVSVRDHGVGIPRERQSHIFEPFYEAVPSGAPGYRGVVALSLYLSKLTIERHRGRIWFTSEEGKGSTFYFSLPLAKGGGNGRGA